MFEVQRLASAVVGQVLAGASLDTALAAATSGQAARFTLQQRGALQDLCYGTLRWLGRLDAMLDALITKPLGELRVRQLLLVALYQLEWTRAAPHAVVDNAVRACVEMGSPRAKGLVNAVLRNYLRRPAAIRAEADRTPSGRYAYPEWWIGKVQAQYPESWTRLLEQGNAHPPLTLRVNARRITRDAYLDHLASEGIAATATGGVGVTLEKPVPVALVPGFADGMVSVQDAGAQMAAPRLDLRPGMRVLDACAAPGGKAAHILELADVELTALDIDERRLQRVADNLRRLDLRANLVRADTAKPDTWWDGRPYDRILADVPCSASGVVRRHPDIKWLRRPGDLARFAATQAAMLDALWRLLGSGGKLLYATCSVFHEENPLQVARFLERHPDALRDPAADVETKSDQPPDQIFPDERHDGFYYARLRKA